jgi:hypothetical protein
MKPKRTVAARLRWSLHGKNVTDRRAIIVLTLFFLAAIVSFAAIIGYLSIKWPLYFFPTMLLFVAVNLALDYRSKLRILTTLDTNGYANIIESQPNTYTGIYRPHWEIGHIQIPLAKRSLFGFPTFESWCPRFADGVPEPDDEHDDLPESPRQFIITFVGTPSKRGQYGHMGMMDRKVSIDLIVELKLLTKAV